jgi:hypothetical protein
MQVVLLPCALHSRLLCAEKLTVWKAKARLTTSDFYVKWDSSLYALWIGKVFYCVVSSSDKKKLSRQLINESCVYYHRQHWISFQRKITSHSFRARTLVCKNVLKLYCFFLIKHVILSAIYLKFKKHSSIISWVREFLFVFWGLF